MPCCDVSCTLTCWPSTRSTATAVMWQRPVAALAVGSGVLSPQCWLGISTCPHTRPAVCREHVRRCSNLPVGRAMTCKACRRNLVANGTVAADRWRGCGQSQAASGSVRSSSTYASSSWKTQATWKRTPFPWLRCTVCIDETTKMLLQEIVELQCVMASAKGRSQDHYHSMNRAGKQHDQKLYQDAVQAPQDGTGCRITYGEKEAKKTAEQILRQRVRMSSERSTWCHGRKLSPENKQHVPYRTQILRATLKS